MNRKLLVVIVVPAVFIAVGLMFLRSEKRKPETVSKIEKNTEYSLSEEESVEGMTEYFNALRNNIVTGMVSEAEYSAAVNASMQMQTKRTVNSVWNELGPDNVGGRTRAFLQDKDTPSLMFAGGVSGGLFVSRTRGSSWAPVNDFQENLSVNCIAQSTSGVIVYGTGEGEFAPGYSGTTSGSSFAGAGIFRSTDGGRTFSKVNSTSGFGNINSMASDMRPGKNILYASTAGSLKKSTDDGLTWTTVRAGNSKEVKVANTGMVFAQSASNIIKSTDEGGSWTVVTPPGVGILRASLAISPQDPETAYFMACGNDGKLIGVYRTKNASTACDWEQIISASTPYFDPLISSAASQGLWDNVIAVDPLDKNHIIMGGVYLAEWHEGANPRYIGSQNEAGGANPAYVHADKHVLQWDMSTTPPTLIVCSDGGISYSSDNLKTFVSRNRGYNVTQFYAVAGDYEGNVVGGTQDNGTQYINKKGNTLKSSVEIKGGDGYKAEVSVKNNAIVFASTYNGNITRSRDYGKSQSCIWDRRIAKTFISLTDTSAFCDHFNLGNWAEQNTKYTLWEHPDYLNTESRLFMARTGQIWMGTGVTDFQNEPIWYMIATAQGSSTVWDLEPTRDGNSLFISNNSTIYRIDGLNSATYYKWSNPTSIPPGITVTNLGFNQSGGRAISSICLDPNDANSALITLGNYGASNYVYKGSNMLGTPTFTNITNNLPPMPVFDGLISVGNSNLMFLGTDLGVYASDDGGSTWSAQTNTVNHFPRVPTLAIRQYIFPSRYRGSIYAGTHGRGFWECQAYKVNINAIENSNNSCKIQAYPNPAVSDINIKIQAEGSENVTLTVMDFTGRIVLVKVAGVISGGENVVRLNTETIQSGTYIVNVIGSSGNNYGTLKLIIRH